MSQAPHVPTDESRAVIRALAQFGIPQEQMARQIGVSVKTLTKHYAVELQDGALVANVKVATNLFAMASGEKGGAAQQATCAIFWAKVRMGWREGSDVQHTHTHFVAGARERLAGKLGGEHPAPGTEDAPAIPSPIGSA